MSSNYQQPYGCFSLGDTSQATWSAPSGAAYAVSVKYTGGDSCFNTQPSSQYSIEMRFQCDPTALASAVLDRVDSGATQCDYIATFRTAIACSASSGYSPISSFVASYYFWIIPFGIVALALLIYILQRRARQLRENESEHALQVVLEQVQLNPEPGEQQLPLNQEPGLNKEPGVVEHHPSSQPLNGVFQPPSSDVNVFVSNPASSNHSMPANAAAAVYMPLYVAPQFDSQLQLPRPPAYDGAPRLPPAGSHAYAPPAY
jgi:hypothetical protein